MKPLLSPPERRLLSATLGTLFFAIGCAMKGVRLPVLALPLGFALAWCFLSLMKND